MVSDTIV
jgi:hypothetical protein